MMAIGTSFAEQAQTIAAAFVDARCRALAVPVYPGQRPANLDEAYAIQDCAIQLDGRAVTGWKVGRINAPLDAMLGANRLAGPVFAGSVRETGLISPEPTGTGPTMPVFAAGFAAAEAEMLLHLAPGWDGTIPQTDAATRAIIDDVRLGIEIASSPYPGINADGPLVTISDFGNNAGLVMGPTLAGWQDLDLCAICVRTRIDGELAGEATAATMLDGPYGAVRFLLANLQARGHDASGGLWVSTGAITGVHAARPGQSITAEFGDHGMIACKLVAASA